MENKTQFGILIWCLGDKMRRFFLGEEDSSERWLQSE